MKRYILALSAIITLSACSVKDPYDAPTMNTTNISVFCESVFKDNIQTAVENFCRIYYIARFLEATPEEQVSVKYDDIRTGLRKNTDSYSYGNLNITFSQDSPFTVGGTWKVNYDYRYNKTMTMRSENEWKIVNTRSGSSAKSTLMLTVLSADDSGMKLNVKVQGRWEEESSYSADYSSENIDVEIINKTPIAISTSYYTGMVEFDFYENDDEILECDMTLRAGMASIFDIR